MYEEIAEAIRNMVQMAVPDKTVVHGSMPPLAGIGVLGYGAPTAIDHNIGAIQKFDYVVNTKDESLQLGIQTLDTIHTFMTRRKDYPTGKLWQIYSISSSASPRLVGREEDGKWLIGSSISVSVYTKGI